MLLLLIRNKQLLLKKKPRRNLNCFVLISQDGKIFASIDKVSLSHEKIDGKGLAVFDVDVQKHVDNVNVYDVLHKYLMKTFSIDGVKVIYEFLRSSQSLTIASFQTRLSCSRDLAKATIKEFVEKGAYTKYYSYWRRTPEFTVWLTNSSKEA